MNHTENTFEAEKEFITEALNGLDPHARVLERLETKKGGLVIQAVIIETTGPLGCKIFYWQGAKAINAGELSAFAYFSPEKIDLDDEAARGELSFSTYRANVIKRFTRKMKDDLGLSLKAKNAATTKMISDKFVKSVINLFGEKIENKEANSGKKLFAGRKPFTERLAIEGVDFSTSRAHPTDPNLIMCENALIFNAVVVNIGFAKLFFTHSKTILGDDVAFKLGGPKQAATQYEELFGAATTASFELNQVVRGNLAPQLATYKTTMGFENS